MVQRETPTQRTRWLTWVMLVVFVFVAFESVLLAVALKGAWFILLGPGIVCGFKAIEIWRDLRARAPAGRD